MPYVKINGTIVQEQELTPTSQSYGAYYAYARQGEHYLYELASPYTITAVYNGVTYTLTQINKYWWGAPLNDDETAIDFSTVPIAFSSVDGDLYIYTESNDTYTISATGEIQDEYYLETVMALKSFTAYDEYGHVYSLGLGQIDDIESKLADELFSEGYLMFYNSVDASTPYQITRNGSYRVAEYTVNCQVYPSFKEMKIINNSSDPINVGNIISDPSNVTPQVTQISVQASSNTNVYICNTRSGSDRYYVRVEGSGLSISLSISGATVSEVTNGVYLVGIKVGNAAITLTVTNA